MNRGAGATGLPSSRRPQQAALLQKQSMPANLIRTVFPWLLVAVVAAVGLGLLTVVVQDHWAPLWLFPCLQGIVLGGCLTAAMRLLQMTRKRWAVAGTVLAVCVMFAAQFYGSYRVYRNALVQKSATVNPQLTLDDMPVEDNLLYYLRLQALTGRPLTKGTTVYGGWVWATWGLDLLLAAGTALLVVVLAFRRPVCPLCGRWYRAVSDGQLLPRAIARASQLVEPPVSRDSYPQREAQFRMTSCPTAGHGSQLELFWPNRVRRFKGSKKQPAAQKHSGEARARWDVPPGSTVKLQDVLADDSPPE